MGVWSLVFGGFDLTRRSWQSIRAVSERKGKDDETLKKHLTSVRRWVTVACNAAAYRGGFSIWRLSATAAGDGGDGGDTGDGAPVSSTCPFRCVMSCSHDLSYSSGWAEGRTERKLCDWLVFALKAAVNSALMGLHKQEQALSSLWCLMPNCAE